MKFGALRRSPTGSARRRGRPEARTSTRDLARAVRATRPSDPVCRIASGSYDAMACSHCSNIALFGTLNGVRPFAFGQMIAAACDAPPDVDRADWNLAARTVSWIFSTAGTGASRKAAGLRMQWSGRDSPPSKATRKSHGSSTVECHAYFNELLHASSTARRDSAGTLVRGRAVYVAGLG